ncbi:dicer-like protein 2 [Paraphoma chrysanthemicola]|uniref:Dicer-like protein 2 n=1 Tax=Paraphoma chrysanthemicola TaxID=798071 RepID=A0A8K0RB31_9PLEO|nr:dicer-like protein 2 [Paraphoma chrysanthemicola]
MADLPEEPYRLRSYQAEMVEESLKSNIVCVMDTGSGKTHVAIERARAELEICQPNQVRIAFGPPFDSNSFSNKLVWFLAPTVTLCEQQYEVFKSNLPGYGMQVLSGSDGVDHWTDQSVWDAVLLNVRIVLSTHQVLLDALTHAFVKMSGLALLVFDEAHHCTLAHPAHRIMSEFYMPRLGRPGEHVPKILGLSASPVMRARATSEDLSQIERNLCATAKTPKLNRTELMRFVHQPELVQVNYSKEPGIVPSEGCLFNLQNALRSYDLRRDPYVVDLINQQQQGHDVSMKVSRVFVSGKTYCRDQLKSLVAKAEAIADELGVSVMEWYVRQCIAQYQDMVRAADSQLLEWSVNEKRHLLNILSQVASHDGGSVAPTMMSLDRLSSKVDKLVELLVRVANKTPDFTGLVFVQQRVWVAALAEILVSHPQTKDLFCVGTFVGTSQSSKRKANIAALAEPRNQESTLEAFREGRINLILATSVLEEGIDISSCHLVICFEQPTNLKSFVQRRGRARKMQSQFFIFIPDRGLAKSPKSWQFLEDEMKAAYLDDMREIKLAEERELRDECGERFFEVPMTGALLTLDNAPQHLSHFCALLASGPFIDTRPQFDFTYSESETVTAAVTLPLLVDPSVRKATSSKAWLTERMAKKDAAFEAYKALYMAGLVNNNLLPAAREAHGTPSELHIPDHTPALVKVLPSMDVWPDIIRQQQAHSGLYHCVKLTIHASSVDATHLLLFLPVSLPTISNVTLYWNKTTHFTVASSCLPAVNLSNTKITMLRSITFTILYSVFRGRMKEDQSDFPWLLCPCDSQGRASSEALSPDWTVGSYSATELLAKGRHDVSKWGLVTQQGDLRKYIARSISTQEDGPTLGSQVLRATRFPKRRDFLHMPIEAADTAQAYTKIEEITVSNCVVDAVPATLSISALLLPSILHKIELSIIAETLRTTILRSVGFGTVHVPLLVQALTSSAADEKDNYQRLEFLGDCVLKYIATIHLMGDNLIAPESHLTEKKGRIVSNGFLARAALAKGLDVYVNTKRFTGAKWAPRYISDLLASTTPDKKVERSSKLIADIIESLIGVSYVAGGFVMAFRCIQTLLPAENWTTVSSAVTILYESAPADVTPTNFSTVEQLIGRTFGKSTLLLDALTHPSFSGPHVFSSYQRLEFLGDAVLDYIVSKRLFAHEPPLSHQTMHAIRTATVNASFLAFRMFETTVTEELTDKTTKQRGYEHRALWQYLRSGGHEIIRSRDIASQRHQQVREQVISALQNDARYPWHLFALTSAPKVLSDIVESVIGAIFVDSHGDIDACEVFVRRLGILGCLERILRDSVDCLHPKERLGHLAVEKDVQYTRVQDGKESDDGRRRDYACQVYVGGSKVGDVVTGLEKLNAETIAAWRAVKILESQQRETDSEGDEFFDAEDGGGIMLDTV